MPKEVDTFILERRFTDEQIETLDAISKNKN